MDQSTYLGGFLPPNKPHEHFAAVCIHCGQTVGLYCVNMQGMSDITGDMTIHYVDNHWDQLTAEHERGKALRNGAQNMDDRL